MMLALHNIILFSFKYIKESVLKPRLEYDFMMVMDYFDIQILEMTGYNVVHGADFRLFTVLAALSQRISSLE